MIFSYRFYFYLFLLFAFSDLTQAQTPYNDLEPPNTFQNADNPYYWKNKLPFPGYWQQDVHYKISADVDEKTNIISGNMELIYSNNSPDTLNEVFFHLYQNAFQPGSYYDNLHKNNKVKSQFGLYESYGLGTLIEDFKIENRKSDYKIDNTILHATLDKPILPGENRTFSIVFKTFFDMGSMRRRMDIFDSYGNTHFNGVHWYPRISVYDRKFGWTTDQHLGREFYGDFGTFDVSLSFANNYIVEATGALQNREEVLPDSLRKALDIKNFKDKPWGEKPSIIIPYDSSKRKTWHFHAENVHDFAFTADPTYRIGEFIIDDISCISLVQEPHAAKWQNAAEYTSKIVAVYNEKIGHYAYPKIIVADARDGMEYPMITLDGGHDPGYRGLLAHEVGHNWFFGMVGNNETYRAALDEGFTQFLTALAQENIDGPFEARKTPKKWYVRKFSQERRVRDSRVYLKYLLDAMRGMDPNLNTHSDDFGGKLRHGGGYGHVYYKTATMLYNLEYVLGQKLFYKAMQNYFKEFSIAHPYIEDFRNSIIRFTKVDLNWFFDQWLETNKYIDYSIKKVKRDSTNLYSITLQRKGSMQMPIDLLVKEENGQEYLIHIPNKWFTKDEAKYTLPKWEGWGNVQPKYTFQLNTNSKLKDLIIDPSDRMADVNKLNNHGIMPIDFRFDSKVSALPHWRKYELKWRPVLWYNNIDGPIYGLHLNGHYMKHKHKFKLNLWQSNLIERLESEGAIGTLPRYHEFKYQTDLYPFMSGLVFKLEDRHIEGFKKRALSFNKRAQENSWFSIELSSSIRGNNEYILTPEEWDENILNNLLNVKYKHPYKYVNGNGEINFKLRTNLMGSDQNYSYINLSAINHNRIGHKINLKTRFFAQIGTSPNLPGMSALYFAGASPDELIDDAFIRSAGFIPQEWAAYGDQTGHFHYGGGLNLRGYNSYKIIERNNADSLVFLYKGSSGIAFNTELEFGRLFPIRLKPFNGRVKLDPYLFADAGLINRDAISSTLDPSDIRFDAGAGIHFTIRPFKVMNELEPIKLRIDFPLFLSHVPFLEEDNFKFRWLIGINRAF